MNIVDPLFDQYDECELKASPVPFVHEENGTLSLHFEISAVQSRMHLDAPDEFLAIGYTRTMMGFLLFNAHPRHIAVIGLGGGSMPKYCHRHLPNAQISVAEINPEVIALRDRFYIPGDSFRFKVHCEDGADFAARHTNEFDVLLVDGFDIGQPQQLCSSQFYDDCYQALSFNGLMVVNLCDDVETLLDRIRRSFQGQVLMIDGEDGENKLVFAGKGNILDRSEEEFRNALEYLKYHHSLRFNRTAMYLQRERRASMTG